MSATSGYLPELQVRSVQRVRDLGEVFTPSATVQDMLDLLPLDIWEPHASATFLEPSCGDGNFLVAILDRKLAAVADAYAQGRLPAGESKEALNFHALQAVASIYAVDISTDNVIGDAPGHEVGARERLANHLMRWHEENVGGRLNERSRLLVAARWVLERNVQVHNMLPFDADGSASSRAELPLVEFIWDVASLSVAVLTTTLGTVEAVIAAETADEVSLFDPPTPTEVWRGRAMRLHEAPIAAPVPNVNHVRNGKVPSHAQ